jgi:hypothetical protein
MYYEAIFLVEVGLSTSGEQANKRFIRCVGFKIGCQGIHYHSADPSSLMFWLDRNILDVKEDFAIAYNASHANGFTAIQNNQSIKRFAQRFARDIKIDYLTPPY